MAAPDHVLHDDATGQEFVYRQPKNAVGVHRLLFAAWNDPCRGYGWDGDQHWTADSVRTWWHERARLHEWATDLSPPGQPALIKATATINSYDDALRLHVLPSLGGLRLRDALDALGFGWITSHTFRKTAATLLNDGGLTVREIADQLGHERVSVTQDTYFGRSKPSRQVAHVLGQARRERLIKCRKRWGRSC